MSEPPGVRLRDARDPSRCAVCHGDLPERYRECGACGVALHTDCRREVGRCPTAGCPEGARPQAPPARSTPDVERTPPIAVLLFLVPGLWMLAWRGVAFVSALAYLILTGQLDFRLFRSEPAPTPPGVTVVVVAAVLLGPAVAHLVLAPMAARRGVEHPHRLAAVGALAGFLASWAARLF
ncbi:MAG: hypothetical protein M9894_27180 [Planctomycetes bacterium]|nr:hypothetical protein [Planctomycetota bacterium]